MTYRKFAFANVLCMLIASSLGNEVENAMDNILLQILSNSSGPGNDSLRGGMNNKLQSKFDLDTLRNIAHCTVVAHDTKSCGETYSDYTEGLKCNWCTLSGKPNLAACVDPIVEHILSAKGHGDLLNCDGSKSGNFVSQSIFSNLKEENVAFDMDEYKCSTDALRNPQKCQEIKDAKGSPCTQCSYTGLLPREVSVCVSNDQASYLHQVPGATCDGFEEEEEEVSPEEGPEFGFDLPDLTCLSDGWGDETKCKESTDSIGNPCKYCTVTALGQSQSLCVTAGQSGIMESKIGTLDQVSISCSTDSFKEEASPEEEEEFGFDLPDLTCLLAGEDKCDVSKAADGSACQFCTMTAVGKSQSLCVSAEQAEFVKSKIGTSDQASISCVIDDIVVTESKATNMEANDERLTVNPTYACNVNGVDDVTCLDESKVGTECTWCDAGIGGFCFPVSWKEKVGKFLECTTSKDDLPHMDKEVQLEKH